jgi:hypothetical protein
MLDTLAQDGTLSWDLSNRMAFDMVPAKELGIVPLNMKREWVC